ncbi:hypothetical protein ACUZ9P_04600 [Desulfovibrio sp. QI0430]
MPHTIYTRQRFSRINMKYKNNTKPQQGNNNNKTKTHAQRRQPVLRREKTNPWQNKKKCNPEAQQKARSQHKPDKNAFSRTTILLWGQRKGRFTKHVTSV